MARARVFYGWRVVAAVFVMLTMAAGLGFYNLTVYLRALSTEQGFSVGAVSAATAVFMLVSGVVGLPVASLINRHDVRWTIAGGAVAAGASLALLGRVTELWQLFAVYTLFGAGFSASALVPGTTVVTRWFSRRRSVALSVASTGLSVGGIVVTPLSASLITNHGLPAVAPWLGLAFVVGVIPVTAAVIRPDPAVLGLAPDGDPLPGPAPERAPAPHAQRDRATAAGAAGVAEPAGPSVAFRDALASRFFLCLTAAYVLVMVAQVGGMAHHFNLVSERVDEGTAAGAVALLAATSVVARLVGGWIVTVVSMRAVTLVLAAGQGGALVVLAVSDARSGLLLGSVLFGLTVGNLLMLHPLLLAEAFGVLDYSRIFSTSNLVMTVGVAIGPALLGVIHDATGGYRLALLTAAGASVAAVAVLTAAGPVDRAAAGQPPRGAVPARP